MNKTLHMNQTLATQRANTEQIVSNHDYATSIPDVGMSDEKLIPYMSGHCRTPLGKFTKAQVSRLLFLAGNPKEYYLPTQKYIQEEYGELSCWGSQYPREQRIILELVRRAEVVKSNSHS